jgi:Cu/Ag efflux protein CusF
MNAISKLTIAVALAISSVSMAFAQQSDHGAHHPASMQSAQNPADGAQKGAGVASQNVEGEVKKVNKEAEKITIRHGELKDLGMPAMTMVFRVKDPLMLDQVKTGDKINFVVNKIGGQLTVMQLEVLQ